MLRSCIVILSLVLIACQSQPPGPPTGVVGLEGFEAFPTPRTFDGPGTIFRINSEGKPFPVTEFKIKVRSGNEEIPKYSESKVLSLSQFLESIGASAAAMPASVRANLSSTTSTNIESTSGRRYRVFDDDVETKILEWAKQAKPKSDSVYYLIRETIATTSLVYKIEKKWLASLNIDAQLLETAGYKGEVKDTDDKALEMNRQFKDERYVWFKAEKITVKPALGLAPGQYRVDREPIQGHLLGL